MDRYNFLDRRTFVLGILGGGSFIATTLFPRVALAQMDKVHASMDALKAKTAKLGPLGSKAPTPLPARMSPPCISGQPK